MILRDRCSTSFDLASLFRGRRSTFNRWTGKIAKHKTHRYEAVSSALNFPLLKEVSQNCCVFAVVKFKNSGSLAALSRFWKCYVQKMRKSRKIAAFSSLHIDRQKDRWIDRQKDRQIDNYNYNSYSYHTTLLLQTQLPVVPHKAVAEVSKLGNLQEQVVVVNHGWQSEATDGPKGV